MSVVQNKGQAIGAKAQEREAGDHKGRLEANSMNDSIRATNGKNLYWLGPSQVGNILSATSTTLSANIQIACSKWQETKQKHKQMRLLKVVKEVCIKNGHPKVC